MAAAPTATVNEIAAIHTFTGVMGYEINSWMRGTPPKNREEVDYFETTKRELSTFLDRASLPKDVTVNRAMSVATASFKVGDVVKDPGFMSTTTDAVPGAHFEIHAPAGAKAASLIAESFHPNEHEVVFQEGAGMRVDAVNGDTVVCTILPPPPSMKSEAQRVVDGVFGDGFTVKVTSVELNASLTGVTWLLDVYDGSVRVGVVVREFRQEPDGRFVVEHGRLFLEPPSRGRGFASEFNDHMVAYYRRAGVDRVVLHATHPDGAVVWAKAGFDWNRDGYAAGIGDFGPFAGQIPTDLLRIADLIARTDPALAAKLRDRDLYKTDEYPLPIDVVLADGGETALRVSSGWHGVKKLADP